MEGLLEIVKIETSYKDVLFLAILKYARTHDEK